MIVFDLGCENNHRFEGWFSSSDDFEKQLHRKLITCPFCSNGNVVRLPHASHIKSGARPRLAGPDREDQQYANVGKEILIKLVEQIIEHTEDVGAAFPEEARKIHYQESPERRIRGTASREEVEELVDEGIEIIALPIPPVPDRQIPLNPLSGGGTTMMFKHILLPTDGSPLSDKGVQRGITFAKQIKARVTTIHVVPQFRILADEGMLPTSAGAQLRQRFIAEAQARGKRIIDKVAKRAKAAGVRCKCIIVPSGGPIYEKIIAAARKEKCDLIFMSSHGRRGLSSVLLGSETAKVLTHSKVPVLVVR